MPPIGILIRFAVFCQLLAAAILVVAVSLTSAASGKTRRATASSGCPTLRALVHAYDEGLPSTLGDVEIMYASGLWLTTGKQRPLKRLAQDTSLYAAYPPTSDAAGGNIGILVNTLHCGPRSATDAPDSNSARRTRLLAAARRYAVDALGRFKVMDRTFEVFADDPTLTRLYGRGQHRPRSAYAHLPAPLPADIQAFLTAGRHAVRDVQALQQAMRTR